MSQMESRAASSDGLAGPVYMVRAYNDSTNPSMAKYAQRLGDALRLDGLEVVDVAPRPRWPALVRRGGAFARFDSLWARYVRYPRIARRLGSGIAHIVDHSHGHLVESLGPERTIVTCHDVILLALAAGRIESDYRDGVATRLFTRDVSHIKKAQAIIADSANTRRDIVELLDVDPAKVEVIFPGLDPVVAAGAEERQAARRRLGFEGPVILTVGNTAFYKNVEGCIKVLALVRKRGLQARMVHAGGTLSKSHGALAESLGVSEALQDRGRVTAAELDDLYASADVLLFPSLYEGFGWPPLEAMARGVPVVCSNAASLPEVVGDAALTARPHDHEKLADHVAGVLTNVQIAEDLIRRGVARAASFRWDQAAEKVEDVYSRVLKRL